MDPLVLVFSGLAFITIGTVAGFFLHAVVVEKGFNKARIKANLLIDDAHFLKLDKKFII